MRPIIGITTFNETNSRGSRFNSVNYNYIKAVHMAGSTPVLIPVTDCDERIDDYIDLVNGILFTGGVDVAPLYYGENPIKEVHSIDAKRDEFELKLFNKAFGTKLPILGICRGMQLINVALKGTLFQDINSQIPDSLGHYPNNIQSDVLYHSIEIVENTILANIFNSKEININSFHHQAVKDLGEGLKASAFSKDGIIEAMEGVYSNGQIILGVQWHPEGLVVKHEEFRKLFGFFVEKCSL